MRVALLPIAAYALTSCSQPAGTAQAVPTAASTNSPAPAPRFDPIEVESMKRQLLTEPKIVDLVYQPGRYEVEWQVGVHPDGTSRIGYAGYVCQRLAAAGLVDDDTDVRVVDIDQVNAGIGFRDASLGHVRCHDGLTINP